MWEGVETKVIESLEGVWIISERGDTDFEEAYHAIRQKEGRMYSDAELRGLPHVGKGHKHYSEWRIRARSAQKLLNHFAPQPGLRILDLGCGNGWMSRMLARQHQVLALDLSLREMQQGARVYDTPQLQFAYGNVFDLSGDDLQVDRVVLAACAQYFPDFAQLIHHLRGFLAPDGEIHVLDTPFYKPEDVSGARSRTRDYYTQMGFPALAANYHAHTRAAVAAFAPRVFHDPMDVFTRVLRALPWNYESPFGWFVIGDQP